MEPILLSLVFALGREATKLAARGVWKSFRELPMVAQAARATAEVLPEFPNLEQQLLDWAGSPAFEGLIPSVEEPDANLTLPSLARSFLDSGFYMPEDSERIARDIVARFISELSSLVLSSDHGMVTHDAREARRWEGVVVSQAQLASQDAEIIARLERIEANQLRAERAAVGSMSDSPPEAAGDADAAVRLSRKLIGDFKLAAAEQLLRATLDGLPGEASADLKSRLLNNLGCTLLSSGRLAEAHGVYTEAHELNPENGQALTNLATTVLFLGDAEKALRLASQALAGAEHDVHAASCVLRALDALGKTAEFQTFLAEHAWMGDDPYGAVALADTHMKRRDFSAALRWAQRSLELEPEGVHALVAASIAEIELLRNELAKTAPAPWLLSDEHRQVLMTAVEGLTRALISCEGKEIDELKSEALAARATARTLLGERDAALQDARDAVATRPDSPRANLAAAIATGLASEVTEALSYLGRIPPEHASGLEYLRLWLLSKAGDYAAAAEAGLTLWAAERTSEAAELALAALEKLGRNVERSALVDEVEAQAAQDPEFAGVAAAARARSHEWEVALALVEAGIQLAPEPLRTTLMVEKGNIFADKGDWAAAAAAYREVVPTSRPSPWTRSLLGALFNAGDYHGVLAVCRELGASGIETSAIAEAESQVLAYAGDWLAAIALADSDAAVGDRISVRLNSIAWTALSGDEDKARERLATIDEQALLSATGWWQFASLRRVLRFGGALEAAYRAAKVGRDDPKVLLAYCGLTLGATEELRDQHSVVLPPCAVKLRRAGAERVWIVLDDDAPADRGLSEVRASDVLGQRLVGRSLGDTVVVDAAEEPWEVVQVTTKYAGLAGVILSKFKDWYPESESLRRIRVDNDDYTEFFRSLDGRSRHVEAVLARYRKEVLPVGSVATLVGADLLGGWQALTQTDGLPYRAASGLAQDQRAEGAALEDACDLLLDATALFTFQALGMLGYLERWPGGLQTSAWLLQELLEDTWKLGSEPVPSGFAGSHQGRYYFHEYAKNQREM